MWLKDVHGGRCKLCLKLIILSGNGIRKAFWAQISLPIRHNQALSEIDKLYQQRAWGRVQATQKIGEVAV